MSLDDLQPDAEVVSRHITMERVQDIMLPNKFAELRRKFENQQGGLKTKLMQANYDPFIIEHLSHEADPARAYIRMICGIERVLPPLFKVVAEDLSDVRDRARKLIADKISTVVNIEILGEILLSLTCHKTEDTQHTHKKPAEEREATVSLKNGQTYQNATIDFEDPVSGTVIADSQTIKVQTKDIISLSVKGATWSVEQ